jgi:alkaline phosphatase
LDTGDRIDQSHHETNAHRALADTLGLDDAVQVAMDKTSSNDTLILVTADHSHTMVLSGKSKLEAHVLGKSLNTDQPRTTYGYVLL